jgi:hypothetical protein
MTKDELLTAIDSLRGILISVSTGGPRIQEVEARYTAAIRAVSEELAARGIANPIPYQSLWDWHGRWSLEDLKTYASRRTFVGQIINPLIDAVNAGAFATPFAPTGWERIDRTVQRARDQLVRATAEEEFQIIGLLCREVLISLGQQVWDAGRHPSLDGVTISDTDAKRQLEAYIAVELASGANEAVRKHARAALDLAVTLQHRRTANFRDAAMCLEATSSAVNLIAIVDGRRDGQPL